MTGGKQAALLLAGAVLGGVLVRVLAEPSSCCARVSAAVRDRATAALGGWIGPVGDALGLWHIAPGLLDLLFGA